MKETLQINLPNGKLTFDKTKHLNLLCYGDDVVTVSASLIDILKSQTKDASVKYLHDMPDGMLSALLYGCTDLDPYENVPQLLRKRFVTDDYISSNELSDKLELYRIYKDIDNDVDILYANLQNYYSLLNEYFNMPSKYEDDDWGEAEYFFRKLKSHCRDYANKHIFYVIHVADYDMSKILYFLNNATVLGVHFILVCDRVGIISEELLEYCSLRLITKSDCSDELDLINRKCNNTTNEN